MSGQFDDYSDAPEGEEEEVTTTDQSFPASGESEDDQGKMSLFVGCYTVCNNLFWSAETSESWFYRMNCDYLCLWDVQVLW